MIKVFGKTDRTFDSNGDCVLKPYKAKLHKEDNGAFYIDVETGIEFAGHILAGNIIVANTPNGDQAFRITNPQKTRKRISFRAHHVFYDAENYLISDSYVVRKTCSGALSQLNGATDETSPFTVFSDIDAINSIRIVRKSLKEAVFAVQERWGGHIVRDNFRFGIAQTIGQDNGVTVRYAKNLKEITCDENWTDVVTKLLPVGKDGCLLNAVDPSADLYVRSTRQYAIPYTKTVSFSQDINREDYSSDDAYKTALVADLRSQAQEYVEYHSLPNVNYTLKANLERITDVGDRIEVIDERLDLDLYTNIISYDYDCLLNRFTEVEFGNFRKKLSQLFDIVNQNIDQSVSVSESNISGDTDVKLEAVNQNIAEVGDQVGRLYLQSGESVSVSCIAVAGFLGENAQEITFTVPMPKFMTSSVTLEELRINVYNTSGTFCLPYDADGNDVLTDADITVGGIVSSENALTVILGKTSFTGSENTPVTVFISNIEVSM